MRLGTPLMLAAVGCVICSRAGALFVGIEGTMLFAAFFAIAGTIWTGSIWLGVATAVAAAICASLVFGVLSMSLRMGDAIGGLVLWLGALGTTGYLLQRLLPNGAYIGLRGLNPVWGRSGNGWADVLLHQEPLFYVALASAVGLRVALNTKGGLQLRACGESMRVAGSVGLSIVRVRFLALAIAGGLAGLAAAALALGVVGSFTGDIVSGRGFIALACVMLGAWRPIGAVAAAAGFAAADAFRFQANFGGNWIGIVPYGAMLVAMAIFWGRAQGPAEEGRDLPEAD